MQHRFLSPINRKLLLLFASLLLSTLGLRAQPLFEISPGYGYRWGGSIKASGGQDLDFQDGRAYGLSLAYSPNRDSDLKFELLGSRQDSGIKLNNAQGLNHHSSFHSSPNPTHRLCPINQLS